MSRRTAEWVGRRGVERDPYLCLAYVTEQGQAQRREGIARAVDLSPRGVGLLVAHELAPETIVVIELLTPSKLWLRGSGVVRHVTAANRHYYRIGVEFASPPVLIDGAARARET